MTIELIEALKAEGVTIRADGDFLELSPAKKITKELIERLKKHKPAILEELKREERRAKVLAILEANPDTQRAFVTDTEAVPDNVILTMAIRNQYTFEMTIPKDRYDGFLVLEILNRSPVH